MNKSYIVLALFIVAGWYIGFKSGWV